MKVLLTGGEGFIGSWTKQALLDRGHTVLSLTNQKYADREQPNGVTVFLGDIRDEVTVTEAMAHSEGWIHLAGVLGTAETIFNPRPAARTNILGGLNVLEAAAQYKIPGVNIAVGNYWMNNTYSITKNTVERFSQMFRDERGLQVTNLRALNAYGPGQSVAAPYGDSKVRKIMPSFMCRALSGHPIEIYGDGTQVMDMVYVKDVADALVSALEYTASNGAISHVLEAGSGVDTTVNDIANEVAATVYDLYGINTEIKHLPMRHGEPEKSVVLGNPNTLNVIGMGKNELLPLNQGLVLTARYFKKYLDNRQ
jgi:UDP-glucose 4-epimerase